MSPKQHSSNLTFEEPNVFLKKLADILFL